MDSMTIPHPFHCKFSESLRIEVEEHQRRLSDALSSLDERQQQVEQLQMSEVDRTAHVRDLQQTLDDKQEQLVEAQQQLDQLEEQAQQMYSTLTRTCAYHHPHLLPSLSHHHHQSFSESNQSIRLSHASSCLAITLINTGHSDFNVLLCW
jgi:DNA repair exonuclease SbcCD ATPase subunit